jgi:hypothetical protein
MGTLSLPDRLDSQPLVVVQDKATHGGIVPKGCGQTRQECAGNNAANLQVWRFKCCLYPEEEKLALSQSRAVAATACRAPVREAVGALRQTAFLGPTECLGASSAQNASGL